MKSMRMFAAGSAAAVLLAAGQAQAVWSSSMFDIYRAGLTDAEHTADDGSQYSSVYGLSTANVLFGISTRYDGFATNGESAWAWYYSGGVPGTVRLGLFDAEHTRNDGYRSSSFQGFNNAGQAYGNSSRSDNGLSAWTWSQNLGNVRIGFTDATHTRDDNYQYSNTADMNESGQVVGHSSRYDGASDVGASAWSWTAGGGTERIGLFGGPLYTRSSDGYQYALSKAVNDAGQAIGHSTMFDGTANAGIAAWSWTDAGGSTRIGLIDAEHTATDNSQISTPVAVGESGQVIGHSNRYVGSSTGQSAWSWTDGGGTVRIGLTDAEHTRNNDAGGNDLQNNAATGMNNTGRVVGSANRYNGAIEAGYSAWTWDSTGGTVKIGLTSGAEFTQSSTGTQVSTPSGVHDNGRVTGTSLRYNGDDQTGQAAWTWSQAGGTTQIGLTDAFHTSSLGYQYSEALAMNANNRIVGASSLYTSTVGGQSVWTWTPAGGTVLIGLIDTPTHQVSSGSSSGLHSTEFVDMNEAGQIIGTSARYGSRGVDRGISGWFYDGSTSIALDFFTYDGSDTLSSNGTARTTPVILTEQGYVLGTYDRYDSGDVSTSYAFLWSLDNGFADLGSLVDGGLSASGWSWLSSVLTANELDLIAGYGSLLSASGTSQYTYVLSTIPSPGAAGLLAVGGLVAARRRRNA